MTSYEEVQEMMIFKAKLVTTQYTQDQEPTLFMEVWAMILSM